MRWLALNNGAAAWLVPSLQPNQFTPFELFLMDGDRRDSVGVLYGKDGVLLRTASIREQRGQNSSSGCTDAVIQMQPWHPDGPWRSCQERLLELGGYTTVQTLQSRPTGPDHPALSGTTHSRATLFQRSDLDVDS